MSVFARDGPFAAAVSRQPTAPGQVVVTSQRGSLFGGAKDHYTTCLLFARTQAHHLSAELSVKRCAMATDGGSSIHVIPLHGLSDKWAPVLNKQLHFHTTFPGFVSSHNGPAWHADDLLAIQKRICAVSALQTPYNTTFGGDATDDNLFARIVRGELEQWRVWESKTHVAFLTPFGNTPGYTVLVPRKHLGSDIFALSTPDYIDMIEAAYDVAQILKLAFETDQVGMIFEGYEIDYAHIKLIPCHKPISAQSGPASFEPIYTGSVTSQLGPLSTDESLELLSSALSTRHKQAISNNI